MNRINRKIIEAQDKCDAAKHGFPPDRELYKQGLREWDDFLRISQAIRGWHNGWWRR